MVEVLIAALLLVIVLLGIVPMFTRSMVSNVAGDQYSQVANLARTRAEAFRKLPFNSLVMTIDSGNTEKIFEDYYSKNDHEWKDGQIPSDGSDPGLWQRTTTVRQYGIGAFLDGVLTVDEALDGGSAPAFVHLKEVEVTIEGQLRIVELGRAKELEVRVLKFK